MQDKYREIKNPPTYPMCELSNGDIVQFMAYGDAEHTQEKWRVFNDHQKRYIYLNEHDMWADGEGNVLVGISTVRGI